MLLAKVKVLYNQMETEESCDFNTGWLMCFKQCYTTVWAFADNAAAEAHVEVHTHLVVRGVKMECFL